MLVTTRHIGEAIVIDGNVEITVLGIKGNRVKIGTDAPKSVVIDRKEKWGRRVSSTTDVTKDVGTIVPMTTTPPLNQDTPEPLQALNFALSPESSGNSKA